MLDSLVGAPHGCEHVLDRRALPSLKQIDYVLSAPAPGVSSFGRATDDKG